MAELARQEKDLTAVVSVVRDEVVEEGDGVRGKPGDAAVRPLQGRSDVPGEGLGTELERTPHLALGAAMAVERCGAAPSASPSS